MQVDLSRVLVDQHDQEIKTELGKPCTVREIAFGALSGIFPDEQISGEEKFKRYELFIKVKNSPDPVDLSVEEIVMLKKLIGKGYGPLAVGQCWMVLEGKT